MTPAKKQTKAEPTPTTMATTAKPETPKPIAPQPQPAAKQQATVSKVLDGWKARGVDLSKLEQKQDGKFILLLLPNFPECKIGPSGGLEVALPSYPNAYDAAINGDTLLAKLQARQAKKQSMAAPAPSKPQPAPASKQETPAVRKTKEHNKLEAALA